MLITHNYFEIFDLPISFEIDKELLAQRYRDLQRAVHPDKYADAPARERRLAMQQATQINEAFQTLKNPITRGHYLLQLHGTDLHEHETITDSEFLMAQMELREQLAELKSLTDLNQFMTYLETSMQQLTDTLTQHFAQKNFQTVRELLRQFQFFKRLYEEALSLEEELT